MYITVFNIPYQRNPLLNMCVLKAERVWPSIEALAQQQSGDGCVLQRTVLAVPSPGYN